jgi:hypothetical protein
MEEVPWGDLPEINLVVKADPRRASKVVCDKSVVSCVEVIALR